MSKVLIFDFDGTIADSMAIAAELAQNVLPEYSSRGELNQSDVDKLRTMTIPQALRYLKIPAYKLPKLVIFGKQELAKRIEELKPVEGISEVIKQLSDQGVEMGIVTSNSKKNVMSFLRKHDLKHHFAFVEAGAPLLGKSRNIKHAMKKQRVDPANCIYVGDEIRDIEASKAINIDCVSVTWGLNARSVLEKLNPKAVIDKPSQLVKFAKAN